MCKELAAIVDQNQRQEAQRNERGGDSGRQPPVGLEAPCLPEGHEQADNQQPEVPDPGRPRPEEPESHEVCRLPVADGAVLLPAHGVHSKTGHDREPHGEKQRPVVRAQERGRVHVLLELGERPLGPCQTCAEDVSAGSGRDRVPKGRLPVQAGDVVLAGHVMRVVGDRGEHVAGGEGSPDGVGGAVGHAGIVISKRTSVKKVAGRVRHPSGEHALVEVSETVSSHRGTVHHRKLSGGIPEQCAFRRHWPPDVGLHPPGTLESAGDKEHGLTTVRVTRSTQGIHQEQDRQYQCNHGGYHMANNQGQVERFSDGGLRMVYDLCV